MKKMYMIAFAAILALSICAGGCKKAPEGEASKGGEKTAAGAAAKTEEAPKVSGAEAFGNEICDQAMKNPAAIGAMFSPKFMTLVAMTAEQQKAIPKETLDQQLKMMEDSMKNVGSTPDAKDKPESCKVVESNDVPCDDLYKKIEELGSMGTKFSAGRAKEVGDSLKVESCGLITVSAKEQGKEQPIEWGIGKIDGKMSILAGFQVKE